MKRLLPIFVIAFFIIPAGIFKFSVFAQDSDTQVSDYALDVQNGEKDTVNDSNAQEAQQGVNQDEEVQAATDDGDPSTGLIQAVLDEAVAPEEANESAKLVENLQANNSENDGEILKDQSIQSPNEKANEDVNIQDDNKAPSSDPDTQSQAPASEQPMENIQQLPATDDQGDTQQ